MKVRAKKLVHVIVWLVVLSVVFNSAMARNAAKDPISGVGSSSLLLAPPPPGVMMQFEGTVDLVVRGDPTTAKLLVNIYSVSVNEEGVQHVIASHVITFEDGNAIVTIDKEVAEPTDLPGLYTLNANMKVLSGTGIYSGATGHFTAHGMMDFTGILPAASFEIRGAVSSPSTD